MKYNPRNQDHRKLLADNIKDKLKECGFEQEQVDCGELIFSRKVDSTDRKVLVFSSIGKKSNMVRLVGSDAIRISAIDGEERGVVKNKRVNRTGEVDEIIDRMYQRMRSTYKEALDSHSIKCKSCGANTFLSKAGRRVCVDICWRKKGDQK
jgi:hypothetical protein